MQQHHTKSEYTTNSGTDVPVEATISRRVENLRDVIGYVHKLAETAEQIADQLGGVTTADKDPGRPPTPVPNGLYEELGNITENIHAGLDRIETALSRANVKLG